MTTAPTFKPEARVHLGASSLKSSVTSDIEKEIQGPNQEAASLKWIETALPYQTS
jgi:hypothetical protein